VDSAQHILLVRDGKGGKDRLTMLPENVVTSLQEHLARVHQVHATALADGYGAVYLPYALERHYPNANRERGWQYVFPAKSRSVDPHPAAACRRRPAWCTHRNMANPLVLVALLRPPQGDLSPIAAHD
jgi:hypothetical protein